MLVAARVVHALRVGDDARAVPIPTALGFARRDALLAAAVDAGAPPLLAGTALELVEQPGIGGDVDVRADRFRLPADRFARRESPAHLAGRVDRPQIAGLVADEQRAAGIPLDSRPHRRARLHRPNNLRRRRLPLARLGLRFGRTTSELDGNSVNRHRLGRQKSAQRSARGIPGQLLRQRLGIDRMAGDRDLAERYVVDRDGRDRHARLELAVLLQELQRDVRRLAAVYGIRGPRANEIRGSHGLLRMRRTRDDRQANQPGTRIHGTTLAVMAGSVNAACGEWRAPRAEAIRVAHRFSRAIRLEP